MISSQRSLCLALSPHATHLYASRPLGGLEERVDGLPQRVHDEPDLLESLVIEDVPPVKHKRGFLHHAVDLLPVVRLELVPLRHDRHGVRAIQRLHRGLVARDVVGHALHVHGDLLVGNLGVVNGEPRAVFDEPPPDVNRRRLARITGVLLEREPEHGDLLVPDRVEHRGDDSFDEPRLLVVVHAHHAVPVVRDFLQTVALADVRQVQNVLLEARPAEPDGGVEKLGADSGVRAERVRYLGDVRGRRLAQRGHGVDGGDALRQKRVGG
mmetsp:Transcript_14010/g.59977  ORF Transcript_14010/g.59977 Transcript_14010/m.59977 type:complete len:268 (+) Transcript_14010:21-824(+)